MRVLLRIKFRALGYTVDTQRFGWGISHDQDGNWTVGKLPTVKESDFKGSKTIFSKWGVTLATVAAEVAKE